MPNATVYLDLKGDGRFDPGDPATPATPFGYYTFTGLAPGTYTVRVAPYPGNIPTYPAGLAQSVTVAGGQNATAGNLGMLPTSVLLPLAVNRTPFGSNNPDIQTAEVHGLYELILGRAPDPSGGPAAVSYLKTGGSLAQLANGLLGSVEYETKVVSSYYQTFLGRAGSSSEVAGWVGLMQQGATEEQVAAGFLTSAEYSARFPGAIAFTQSLYGSVLGRLPTSAEVYSWLTSGATQAQEVAGFLGSYELGTRAANGFYGITYVRPSDPTTTAYYAGLLQVGFYTEESLAVSFLSSAEFIARASLTVA